MSSKTGKQYLSHPEKVRIYELYVQHEKDVAKVCKGYETFRLKKPDRWHLCRTEAQVLAAYNDIKSLIETKKLIELREEAEEKAQEEKAAVYKLRQGLITEAAVWKQ